VLQHVTLEVPRDRVRDCVRFWELLGFREIEPPPLLRDRFVWVERNGTHIHLMPLDDPTVPEHGHAAVVAGEAVVEALVGAGFEPRPGSNAWGAPRWFVRDPAGHRVEVMSAAPPSGPVVRD
jgi:catechol 2,3-dioxygenase-like lactoylglutathione lyase family enzyme